ncbi:unnamed protein product [Owenia fusiformis]|uniref:TIR domain-containing protein n=1 Tax=Owenia fusiformis TaxID=6347 RepID=A0A8S4NNV7_OWEFU|nr:unnamed protein product [Owenia fusiformis]
MGDEYRHLIEHDNEDIEGINTPIGEDGGASGLEMHVVENMKEQYDKENEIMDEVIVNIDAAGVVAGEILEHELEEGKEYHLFFCHSSVNLAWVWAVVKILEAPPYNLQCAFSERDFLPGQNDMNEMFRCITGSMRTVFVLTPAFMDSRWCEWEMQMAQTASVANNISLLPIMLEECPIPDTIKHINYVDVTDRDIPKAAVMLRKHVEKPGQGFIPQDANLRANGSSFLLRETIQQRCCGSKLKFDMPENGTDELEQRGITISEEKMNEILQTLNLHESGIRIARASFRCLPKYVCCVLILSIVGLVWLGFWIAMGAGNLGNLLQGKDPQTEQYSIWLLMPFDNVDYSVAVFIVTTAFVLASAPLITPFIYSFVRERKQKGAIRTTRDISLTAMTEYKMYIWFGGIEKNMYVVKYDINQCLQQLLLQIQPNIIRDEAEFWKLDLTKTEFPIYINKLMQGTLNKAPMVMHKTINNNVCFCQHILAIPQYKHMFNHQNI